MSICNHCIYKDHEHDFYCKAHKNMILRGAMHKCDKRICWLDTNTLKCYECQLEDLQELLLKSKRMNEIEGIQFTIILVMENIIKELKGEHHVK